MSINPRVVPRGMRSGSFLSAWTACGSCEKRYNDVSEEWSEMSNEQQADQRTSSGMAAGKDIVGTTRLSR